MAIKIRIPHNLLPTMIAGIAAKDFVTNKYCKKTRSSIVNWLNDLVSVFTMSMSAIVGFKIDN